MDKLSASLLKTEDTQKTEREQRIRRKQTKTEEREREGGREKLTGFDFPVRERATYREKKREMRIYSTKTPIF